MTSPIKTKVSNESGFTLIELLIAAVLLSWMTLSLIHFLGSMMTHNTNNDRRTQALVLAEEQIETLKNQGLTGTLTNADSGSDTPGGGIFTRVWTVSTTTDPPSVSVRVSWQGVGDTDVRLTTMLYY